MASNITFLLPRGDDCRISFYTGGDFTLRTPDAYVDIEKTCEEVAVQINSQLAGKK